MRVKVREKSMTANMVPVNVCGDGGNRLVSQPDDFIMDVADSESGMNQQTALRAIQEIAMRFFPVAVFAYDITFPVNLIYRKPRIHLTLLSINSRLASFHR